MLETQAQIVLLVRAFEEADREGRVLSSYARATATRRALRVTGLAKWPQELADAESTRYSETVVRRARVLCESLDRKIPGLRGMMRIAQFGVTTGPLLIFAAFGVGLLTNALGPGRRIHLLSLPLLGIIAWNLAVYALLVATIFFSPARRMRQVVPWLAERFLRSALWRRLHGWRVGKGGPREWKGIAARAMMRFAGSWHRLAGELLAARVRRTLHLTAAALVSGVIVGMYVRGLGLEYQATWESTWLTVGVTQWILRLVLGLPSLVTGLEIPDVAALRGPDGAGPAAVWIHLYAAAAALYVVLPRTVLTLAECWRCRTRADLDVDLHDAYYRRVFTEWRGGTRRIEIVPYSYAPKEHTLDALRRLLQDYFGARADVRARAPLAYGDDTAAVHDLPRSSSAAWSRQSALQAVLCDPERETCHVVLFNMAQPPEAEVHGRFLGDLMERLDEGPGRLLVVVDSTAYRQRVADPQRWSERFANWQRVARAAGLTAIELDPERPIDDESVEAVGSAIWRGAEAVEAAG